MGARSSFANPYNDYAPAITSGSASDGSVDRLLGTAYDIVRHVAANIEYVKHVSTHLAEIYRLSGSIEAIDTLAEQAAGLDALAANLDAILQLSPAVADIQAISAVLTQVVAVANQLTEISAVYANLTAVQTTATNIAGVNAVAADIAAILAVNGKLPELVDIANNLDQLLSNNEELVAQLEGILAEAQAAKTAAEAAQASATALATAKQDKSANLDLWSTTSPYAYQRAETAIPPSFAHRFGEGQSLPSGMSFVRASSASRRNRRGQVEQVGDNVLRDQYGPGGVYRGVLIEGASSNLLPYSEDFTTGTAASAWMTNNVALAPDGTMTAARQTPAAGLASYSNSSFRRSYVKAASSLLFTESLFVKDDGAGGVRLDFYGTSSSDRAWLDVNLLTGTIVNFNDNGAGSLKVAAHVEAWEVGWYRIGLTANTNTDTVLNMRVSAMNADGTQFTGDGVRSILLWGAQLEQDKLAPTSYIKTVGAAATRAADQLTLAKAAAGWRDAEWSMYFEGSINGADEGGNVGIPLLYARENTNVGTALYLLPSNFRSRHRSGSADFSGDVAFAAVAGTDFKVAATHNSVGILSAANGTTGTRTAGQSIIAATEIRIGRGINGGTLSDAEYLYGCVKAIGIFDVGLTPTQLAEITIFGLGSRSQYVAPAVEAASGIRVNSRDSAATLNLSGFDSVTVNRWSDSAKLAPTLYERVPQPANTQPATPLRFQDKRGTWFAAAGLAVSLWAAGAIGNGVTDDWDALKRIEGHLQPGMTVTVPPGDYYTPYRDHAVQDNWINITKSGVSFEGKRGTATFENFLFLVMGQYGAPQLVGAAGFTRGDQKVNTATAHGLAVGDYVQLLSGINAYSPDAGEWQNGSQNPTDLDTSKVRFAEIHRVFSVDSSTTATIYDNVIFPGYKNNTTGQSQPMAGITGAEIRKLTPVVGVTFKGVGFKNITRTSYRQILARCAVDMTFEDCHFNGGSLPGNQCKTQDVFGLTFLRCDADTNPIGASGSAWNRFQIAGGCQKVTFDDCEFHGGQQTIDFTHALLTLDVGHTGDALRCDGLTTSFMTVVDSDFFGSSADGFTTHPGTYYLEAHDNTVVGAATGIRVRSRHNIITGNILHTSSTGIAMSAFHEDTLIQGNEIKRLNLPVPVQWQGISVIPMGSETMSSNDLQRVYITGNIFSMKSDSALSYGIQFRHTGNGVPPNGSFTLFTNAIKSGLSRYVIEDNEFSGCGVLCQKWINGVHVLDNSFTGGCDSDYYVNMAANSARHRVDNNYFDTMKPAVLLSDVTDSFYSYNTKHEYGFQRGGASVLTVSLTNVAQSVLVGGDRVWADNYSVVNGGTFAARRGSGDATTRIDAIAEDGVSNVTVRVFENNPTTGAKNFVVFGNIRLGALNGPIHAVGAGSPEGNLSGAVGSAYWDTTNGTQYNKKTGTGNTGWKLVTQAA